MSATILDDNEVAESLHSPPLRPVMSPSASSQPTHVTPNITPEHASSSSPAAVLAAPPSSSVQSPPPESRFSKPWQNLSALIAVITVPVMVYFAVKTYNLAAWTAAKDYCEFQLNFVNQTNPAPCVVDYPPVKRKRWIQDGSSLWASYQLHLGIFLTKLDIWSLFLNAVSLCIILFVLFRLLLSLALLLPMVAVFYWWMRRPGQGAQRRYPSASSYDSEKKFLDRTTLDYDSR